ncbi:MAG TPA: hydroxyquinol 1,2-dioxygenase [Kofleriaceae bacterium]
MTQLMRHHHLTLSVGTAQEDFDFHTKLLGLKNVKKTALYDGDVPIYHFYYGNDHGDVSTLITTFPMRQSGRKARPGTGQISTVMLSVPSGSAGFWERRLKDQGYTAERDERFGETVVRFSHPCGIKYELVETANDVRAPYSKSPVPQEHAIRGTHGIRVAVRDIENSDEFMQAGWNGQKRNTDRHHVRYEIGVGGTGTVVEFEIQPHTPHGSWQYGEGVPHHCAFEVADYDAQDTVKHHLVGLGYTDVSDRKDRGYFDSVYVRTPGGALFEATVSKATGFTVDEPYEELGSQLQIPPPFLARKDELARYLEPIPK